MNVRFYVYEERIHIHKRIIWGITTKNRRAGSTTVNGRSVVYVVKRSTLWSGSITADGEMSDKSIPAYPQLL